MVKAVVVEGENRLKTIEYSPTCKHGFEDCVRDPAYIKATYPNWYKELYGDISPEQAAETGGCCACLDREQYDNEDK